jgi:hypothetical protein
MTPEQFEAEWTRCAPWISAALEYSCGTHLLEDVKADVMSDNMTTFWPGKRSAIVTELIVHPRRTQLHFWLCGGDLDEVINEMRPEIEAWGKALGATAITITGRMGWQKVLKEHGYAPVWNVCLLEI